MILISGQRYLFYYENEENGTFRANFIKILHSPYCRTIIVNHRENSKSTEWCIDSKLILKITSLSDIIHILPEEILRIIDNYL